MTITNKTTLQELIDLGLFKEADIQKLNKKQHGKGRFLGVTAKRGSCKQQECDFWRIWSGMINDIWAGTVG